MNRESLLREARTIEAMKKGYMGMEGKLAVVAKRMGQPIIHHGLSNFHQSFLDDPFSEHDEDEMPTMADDDRSYEIGMSFNGLSSGMNMSITLHSTHNEIVCEYQGKKVYRELAGELEAFVPNDEWESKIESLYNRAKRIEKKQKPAMRRELVAEAERRKRQILEEFKEKWGLT
jgi:hypothetical protein